MFDALRRAGLNLARGIVHTFDDSPKLQTIDFRGLQNELIPGAENFAHPFGHYAVPVPPDEQTKAAEVIMGFIDGNRSHPAILGHIDRRYRPTGGEQGQIGHYHYQGASHNYTSAGYTYSSGPNKKPHLTVVGSTKVKKSDGQIVTDTGTKLFTNVVHLGAGGSLPSSL